MNEVEEHISEKELLRLEELDWGDIEGLNNRNSKYSAEQKIHAVTAFVIEGSLKKAAEQTGLGYALLRGWATRTTWWKDVIDKIRKQHNDELDAKICIMIDKSMEQLDDRIVNGDFVIGKDGRTFRKKIGGKDLTTMIGILYDKRALMRGDPTSRTANASPTSVLQELKGEFEKLSERIQEKQVNDLKVVGEN